MQFLLTASLLASSLLGSAGANPVPFTRMSSPDSNLVSLETSAHQLVDPAGKLPTIWLVSTAHIGLKSYYASIQKILDAQTVTIYEGVKRNDDKGSKPLAKLDPNGLKSVYEAFSDALGLSFQLNEINYNHSNWKDVDLTWDQLVAINKKASGGKPSEFNTLTQVLDPTSPMAKQIVSFMETASPGVREAFKIFMIQKFSNLDALQSGAFDPATQETILTQRNNAVLNEIATEVKTDKPTDSIAIYYGAMHLPSMESTLISKYGYQVKQIKWMTAATGDKSKLDASGKTLLNTLEKQTAGVEKSK